MFLNQIWLNPLCPASQQKDFSRIYLDISSSSTGADSGNFQRNSWKNIPLLSIGYLNFFKISQEIFLWQWFCYICELNSLHDNQYEMARTYYAARLLL